MKLKYYLLSYLIIGIVMLSMFFIANAYPSKNEMRGPKTLKIDDIDIELISTDPEINNYIGYGWSSVLRGDLEKSYFEASLSYITLYDNYTLKLDIDVDFNKENISYSIEIVNVEIISTDRLCQHLVYPNGTEFELSCKDVFRSQLDYIIEAKYPFYTYGEITGFEILSVTAFVYAVYTVGMIYIMSYRIKEEDLPK